MRRIVDALNSEQVTTVFALMGDGNLDLVSELEQSAEIRVVHSCHEQGAVAMADGYARFAETPGVVTVTHGPGVTNTATSLVTAVKSGSPVVFIAPDTPVGDAAHPQAFAQLDFLRSTGARIVELGEAGRVHDTLRDVFGHVRSGGGPAVLNVPTDVLLARGPDDLPAYQPATSDSADLAPKPLVVDSAVQALRSAERPALLVGRGVALADSEAIIGELAQALGAPIVTSLKAKGFLADHDLHVGVAGGLGAVAATEALAASDCIVVLGASANQWTTDGGAVLRETQVVRIDIDARAFTGHDGIEIVGDARAAAEQIVEALTWQPVPVRPPWFRPEGHPVPVAGPYREDADRVHPERAVAALEHALPERRIIVVDAGHFGSFAQQGLTVHSPRDYAFTHDFGAIGQGIGIAIGAAVARNGERVTLVLGDGCFVMSLNELATAVRYDVDITFFVMNDGGYGQERHALNAKGMPAGPSDHPWPDIQSVATGFGIPSLNVRFDAQLADLTDWLQARRGPALVNIHIDPDVQNRAFADIADRLRRGSMSRAGR